jgi:hypothetical protein
LQSGGGGGIIGMKNNKRRIGPMIFSFDLAFCVNSGIIKIPKSTLETYGEIDNIKIRGRMTT